MISNNSPILTICIPTFNRAKYLDAQLLFFERQLIKNRNITKSIRFVVSDNNSDDNTDIVVNLIRERNNFFDFYKNTENLGLVGNIIASLDRATSEYIWFVSDDDELKDGILEEVITIISENNHLHFIFLNYTIGREKGYNGNTGLQSNSKQISINIFNESYGSLVFMTSCVYKRKHLIELKQNNMFSLLSAPLLYSFYCCSKGEIYITMDPWIRFNQGNASYASIRRVTKLKFEEYIPILEYLPSIGYSRKEVLEAIKLFIQKQSHTHIIYFFISPIKSIRFYRYYSFKTILAIPINIVRYLLK